jgi:hypothetical protein
LPAALHPMKRTFMQASKILCQATWDSLRSGLGWRPLGCDLFNILRLHFQEHSLHALG